MPKTVTVTTGQALSLTTGKMLCESFGLVHEAAEAVMQQPLWTHMFANEQVVSDLKGLVLGGGPAWLVEATESVPDFSKTPKTEIEAEIKAWLATLPSPTVEIELSANPGQVPFGSGLEHLGKGLRE